MVDVYNGCTVGVVVPAYNEEGYVGDVIDTMPPFVDRVYLIDDASIDGTWAEITEHVEAARKRGDTGTGFSEKWVPIQHDENTGVGGAIVTGYRRALDDGVDVTAVMAGDAQMNPEILHRIIEPVVDGRVEYAKGSRFLREEDYADIPRFRLLGNALLTFLTQIASGYWEMTDSQNGYTAISHRALTELDLDALYQDYGFANDLLVRLNVAGLPIADVERSSSFAYGDWKSHIDLTSFVPKTSLLLFRCFLWRLRKQYMFPVFHPLLILYALGTVGVLAGIGQALTGAASRLRGEGPDGGSPLLVFLVGGLALAAAMVLDRIQNEGMLEQVYSSNQGREANEADRPPVDPVRAEN